MELTKNDLEPLQAIAEKAQKSYEALSKLKEISEQSKTNKTPILITKKEAAAFLQISVGHLALLRHRGTGPKFAKSEARFITIFLTFLNISKTVSISLQLNNFLVSHHKGMTNG